MRRADFLKALAALGIAPAAIKFEGEKEVIELDETMRYRDSYDSDLTEIHYQLRIPTTIEELRDRFNLTDADLYNMLVRDIRMRANMTLRAKMRYAEEPVDPQSIIDEWVASPKRTFPPRREKK